MSADRSQTERIRRLRSKVQAVRRAECAACPEEGPLGPTDQSTRLSRSLGQMVYYRQIASGATVTDSCCASSAPPLPCGLCTGSGITIDMAQPIPSIDPTACYSFIYNSGAFPKGEFCVTFTSGITLYLPYSDTIYPPTGYSLTGVQSVGTVCFRVFSPILLISSCDQSDIITVNPVVIANDIAAGNDAIVSLTSATGCSSIYVGYGGSYYVVGPTGYTVTCLPPPTPLTCNLCNATETVELVCDTSVDLISDKCYNFHNGTGTALQLEVALSTMSFSIFILPGATYPPVGVGGISQCVYQYGNCSSSCLEPASHTIITGLPASGVITGRYITNNTASNIVLSLTSGTDCYAIYLAEGDSICEIKSATLYSAVAI